MARQVRHPFRLGPRGERWFDVALVGFLLLPVPVFLIWGSRVEALLMLVQIAPLVFRRRHPTAVFAVVAAACGVQALLVDEPLWGQVAVPVAVYSVARYGSTAASLAAAAVGLVGAGIASYDWLRPYPDSSETAYVAYALSIGAIVVTASAVGALRRTRQAYVDALVERGERLEREATQQAALAAIEERHRIAREMHDVVAHGLTTIVVQADGARAAAAQDPGVAAPALATIAEAGREAIAEMRRMLGLLRSGVGETEPQPRLTDLPALIEEARRAGTTVASELPDPLPPVSDGVALTAYRVVQEALTNVRKHAGPGATATVRLRVDGGLVVDVSDDGRGAAAPYDGRGLGLTGMRERVTTHGGHLEAGPRPGGGFAVHARISL
ncbi:sensor histidine kinase [Nocardioides bizhenqiangii]|uniref:Oxygen sensor histidine kinase NreB n=1 Tax=Nocardioides bizhenqiangii TaxID=3095076 RepID=A0ABZ0ZRM8_9ACTN|nr:sensor histidine kinase [Nocardioides sp. HM61]WQQ26877.1 sensor histidine kinase [Nocardioides sp. HM61]